MSQDLTKTEKRKSGLRLCLLFLAVTWGVGQSAVASDPLKDDSNQASSSESVSVRAPFARVYLALQGCTSCAACRSVIRQMTKSATKDAKVSLPLDAVEIQFADPAPIPLKKVVGKLARNRLHNLKLVDVLFDASGEITSSEGGLLSFSIETTRQRYALTVPDGINPPPLEKPLRLSAVVRGWRGPDGDLTLELKSFKAGQDSKQSFKPQSKAP